MAYETGTASNQVDLINKIVAFATTNSTLVGLGQQWVDLGVASGQTTGKWLRGPGMSGGDQIFAGIQAYVDTPNDTYCLDISGSHGFNASSNFASQIGQCPKSYVSCWNSSMPYWIVGNGQRIICVFKVSTTYHALYLGKILPYGTPSQYGYPFYVGGESFAPLRWSDSSFGFRQFIDPGATSMSMNTGCYLCYPDGSWQFFGNFYGSGSENQNTSNERVIWPYAGGALVATQYLRLREMRENIDGSYTLLPIILHASQPSRQVFGELDGCHYVSGFGNAAENIITISGQDYLVVQNIFRTARHNYWALKLA